MATKYASQRRKVASSHQSCQPVINHHDWAVEASTNGDKVIIGQLPAGHRLVGELCSVQVDTDVAAMTFDVCVDDDASILFDNVAAVASTFGRTAFSAWEMANTIGVSDSNRDIYLILSTAPATSVGNVKVTIASAPAP